MREKRETRGGDGRSEGKRRSRKRGEGKRVGKCVSLSNTNTKLLKPYFQFFPLFPLLPYEGRITSKVPHTQHSPHTSLTLCPLQTSGQNEGGEEGRKTMGEEEMGRRCIGISGRGKRGEKRSWADPKMHSPYSDG